MRGDLRRVVAIVLTDFFGFAACAPEDSATREHNRQLYALLSTDEHCYMYLVRILPFVYFGTSSLIRGATV